MRKQPAKRSSSQKKVQSRFKLFLLASVVLGAIFGVWYSQFLAQPADINLVGSGFSNGSDIVPRGETSGKIKAGCYYQEVQCIQAPCEPVLVCEDGNTPDPKPGCYYATPSCPPGKMCPQVVQLICPVDASAKPTSSPVACTKDLFNCPDGSKVGRTGPNCEFMCPTGPDPKPSSTPAGCIPRPSCMYDEKACRMDLKPGTVWCPEPTNPPQPSVAPIAVGTVATFTASNPCGDLQFREFNFTCRDNRKIGLKFEQCTSFYSALKQVTSACGGAK